MAMIGTNTMEIRNSAKSIETLSATDWFLIFLEWTKKILFLLFWSSLSLLSLSLLSFVVFDVVIVILVIVAVVFVEVIVVIEGCNPLSWDNKDFESNCDFVIILRKVFFWKLSSRKKSSPKIVKPLEQKSFLSELQKEAKKT